VIEELATRLPASIELTFSGLLLAVLIAIPLGILAATRPNSWVDHLCRLLVTAGVSPPTFFTAFFSFTSFILFWVCPRRRWAASISR
jgi:peptide/nickel transport system permease protein